jgi:hypothetical protein
MADVARFRSDAEANLAQAEQLRTERDKLAAQVEAEKQVGTSEAGLVTSDSRSKEAKQEVAELTRALASEKEASSKLRAELASASSSSPEEASKLEALMAENARFKRDEQARLAEAEKLSSERDEALRQVTFLREELRERQATAVPESVSTAPGASLLTKDQDLAESEDVSQAPSVVVESLKIEIVQAWKTVEESRAEKEALTAGIESLQRELDKARQESKAEKEMLESRIESLQCEVAKARQDLSRSLNAYLKVCRTLGNRRISAEAPFSGKHPTPSGAFFSAASPDRTI